VVGNFSCKRAVLLHPPTHVTGEESQNVDFVLFLCSFIGAHAELQSS